jgi:hypothetical protein
MPTPGAVILNGQIGLAGARQMLAANGKYFVATNPTPGTGVLCGTVTSFSATADGLFTISNGAGLGGPNIQLDYLKLMMSGTAPTATTVQRGAVYVESGIVAPSAGNVVVTARNVLPTGPGSVAAVNGFSSAMCTIPAAVGTRTLVANWQLPTSLGVTGDEYLINFGAEPVGGAGQLTAVRATAPARLTTSTTPVTIPPGYTGILDWWWVGQATNGPTFEFELAWCEL